MTRKFGVGDILSRTFGLMRVDLVRALPTIVVLSALGVVIDAGLVADANAPGMNLLVSAVSTVASYWITKGMLQDMIGTPLPARFPAFFGLGLLTGLGILFGLVVLIVPGIVLFVLWSVSAPMLLDGGPSVTESMAQSWRATRPHFWPILGAFALCYGAACLLALGGVLAEGLGDLHLVSVLLTNTALSIGLVLGWHVALAIHALLAPPGHLGEVFS